MQVAITKLLGECRVDPAGNLLDRLDAVAHRGIAGRIDRDRVPLASVGYESDTVYTPSGTGGIPPILDGDARSCRHSGGDAPSLAAHDAPHHAERVPAHARH